MPFDFNKLKPYTVDYPDLKKTLLAPGFFLTNQNWQVHYIDDWIRQLETLDEQIVSDMSTYEAKFKYTQDRLKEPEVFQIPITIGKNTLLIAFRISPLLELISQHSSDAIITEIPINEFLEDTIINWTQEHSSGKPLSDNPIIIVPLPIGKNQMVVVDGNHRLSDHVRAGSQSVRAYTFAGKMMIDNRLFTCGFDWFLYTMLLEFRCAKECHDGGEPDELILSKSMLYNSEKIFRFAE